MRSIPRSALPGLLLGLMATASHAQHAGHGSAQSGLGIATSGYGYYARWAAANSYTPTYLGLTAPVPGTVSSIHVPGGPGVAFSGSMFFNPSAWNQPLGQEGPGGLILPHAALRGPVAPAATPIRTNPTRADSLMTVGDRSFRGGNYHRAEDRYRLAMKANPSSPLPHLHLSQIDIVRGDYAKAAGHLRDSVATGGRAGWLLEAPDIQSLYGEPTDFTKQIARLESHLQAHPEDRNAWFVLGVEHFLSGHPRFASDAFTRLTDRAPDEALTAFLDASTVAYRTANPH